MPCRELLCHCSCNIYVCWPIVTVTNTVTVQTCLLVECCCKMDACWGHSNSMPADILSLNIAILLGCASLSAIPAGMVSHYYCACWYGVSLSAMPAGVVPHYKSSLLFGTSLSAMPVGVMPHYWPCLLVWCLTIGPACLHGTSI